MKAPKPYCVEKRVRKSDGKATYRVKIRTQFGKATRTFDRLSDAKQWAENTKVEMRRGDFVDYLGKRRTQVSLVIDRYLPFKVDGTFDIHSRLIQANSQTHIAFDWSCHT